MNIKSQISEFERMEDAEIIRSIDETQDFLTKPDEEEARLSMSEHLILD